MKNLLNTIFVLLLFSNISIASIGEGISERGTLSSKAVTSVDDEVISPEFLLHQNYPNPFNPSTKISFTVDEKLTTKLKVYNSIGEEIRILFDDYAAPGKAYNIKYDSGNLSSGIYYYVLENRKNRVVRKMILLK